MIDSMHLFVLAVLVFAFGLGSRSFARTVITGTLAFVAFGMLLAPPAAERLGLGNFFDGLEHLDPTIHLLGEITLVVVLFTDAAQIQLASPRRGAAIPLRLPLIGMPLTIALGAVAAWPFFGDLGLWELALLAAMLAPTDADLGQAVVTSERVPLRIRQGLSVERRAGWQAWTYGALSLTVIRMLPVALSMLGLGVRPVTIGFLAWFGPRARLEELRPWARGAPTSYVKRLVQWDLLDNPVPHPCAPLEGP